VAIARCMSAIPALLAFSIRHDSTYNLQMKCMCCQFAQAIGITSDPRITFPDLLKIRASTRELHAVPAASERRRARRTVVAPSPAISSIGALPTPADGGCSGPLMENYSGVDTVGRTLSRVATIHGAGIKVAGPGMFEYRPRRKGKSSVKTGPPGFHA
jgi:hypothetical protein